MLACRSLCLVVRAGLFPVPRQRCTSKRGAGAGGLGPLPRSSQLTPQVCAIHTAEPRNDNVRTIDLSLLPVAFVQAQ